MVDRMDPFKAKRLVMVEWEDSAQATSSWNWLSEFKPTGPIRCFSVGWLIQHDDLCVLAQSTGNVDWNDPDCIQISGILQIPSCSVKSIQNLV